MVAVYGGWSGLKVNGIVKAVGVATAFGLFLVRLFPFLFLLV